MSINYDGKNLKNTLRKISSLIHQSEMELHEVEKENQNILKMFEVKQSKSSDKIVTGVSNLIGRTPKRIIPLRKYGYNSTLLIECEDGQRVLIYGDTSENNRIPDFEVEQMISSGFFTQEEIDYKIKFIASEKLRFEENQIREKQKQLERLKSELEVK